MLWDARMPLTNTLKSAREIVVLLILKSIQMICLDQNKVLILYIS